MSLSALEHALERHQGEQVDQEGRAQVVNDDASRVELEQPAADLFARGAHT